ncbi:MAG: protein kinase [Ardenticatenaceae bacterium]|nr:protein kinase [Anaerolineales bacterium]MCB8920852.1 protein kinase [Ardenticatenaceae bacterium]MCB8991634.1 protein kinase [Ardenticatenaceae bacterium]MCB9002730.1 protein kinase [Ardenticatenaceae bacterium]
MNYLIGQQIEHYRIEAVLGDGGMGTVYRAYDLQTDQLVAVKVMHQHLSNKPQFQRRFAQEAQATAHFNSPYIIKILRYGSYREMPYIVMEYVPGGSLTDYLKQLQWSGRRIALEEVMGLSAQVAEGLSYAHQRGVIHRDVKPDNILLRSKEDTVGAPRQAVLTDFGLAVLLKEGEEVSTNPFMGSLPYMSPEQCSNLTLDGRSDIYALGVMLYQLTTGQMPYRIEAPADIVKHLQETPLPPRLLNPDLPQVVEDVVLKALAKKPSERFQTGAELAHKLRTIDLQSEDERGTAVAGDGAVTQWVEARWVAGVDVRNRVDVNQTWTSEGEYRLFITHQWEESRVVSLTRSKITIGRHPDNDVVLGDRSISNHHVRLERTPTGWQVLDLGSTNGAHLDDTVLEFNKAVEWSAHQTLRLGPYSLQWQPFTGRRRASAGANGDVVVPRAGQNGRSHPPVPPITPPPATGSRLAAAAVAPVPIINVMDAPRALPDWDESTAAAQVGEALELALSPASLEIVPGTETAVQATILNLGSTVEDVDVRVLEQGVTPAWMTLNQTAMKLLPGESQMVILTIAPPQDSTVLAGEHIYEIEARTSRGASESITGHVQVAQWEEFALDMHPRNLQEKIVSRLTISDQGNFSNRYQIEGLDDSDALRFDFGELQNATLIDDQTNQQWVRLAPGATGLAPFTIHPKKRPWFRAPTRPFPFKMRVRTDTADWQALDGQVSISPRFSLRVLLLILFLLLLMALLGFWVVNSVQTQAQQEASETATAVWATISIYEGEFNSAQATADALLQTGDVEGAAIAQATADALRATLQAQNAQLDEVTAQLEITPTPVPIPVDITLDNLSVPENADIGTTVGTFTASLGAESRSIQPEKPRGLARLGLQTAPRLTFSLVSGTGDTDNDAFFLEGAVLKTAERFDFETQSTYSIRVGADNGVGGTFEKAFSITIADLSDTPSLTISDVTVDEDAGTAVLTLNMTHNSNSDVSVDLSTADGTAKEGDDYTAVEETITWKAGETGEKSIEVPILDDELDEPDETFTVELSNPVIGVVADGLATVTIVDNEDKPTLEIADVSVSEGDGTATLTVVMTGLSSQEVSVSYATADGTAKSNADYTATNGTLTWKVDETGPKTFDVPILDDDIYEPKPDETLAVNLSNATNATLADGVATVSIVEDDPAPILSIVETLLVDEPEDADGNVYLTVSIDRASSVNVTVNYGTSNETAVKGRDYNETTGTLTWQPGETGVKSIPVLILADQIYEPDDETFLLTLTDPVNAELDNDVAQVSITDSDEMPTVEVLDDVVVAEGPGAKARIQVRLNGGSSSQVVVSYVAEDGTATADLDYRPPVSSATITWSAEEVDVVKEITVDLIDDRIDEPDDGETFSIVLSGVTSNNAALATNNRAVVTITDNDDPPVLELVDDYFEEGDGQQAVRVRLVGGSYQDTTVNVTLNDDTAVFGDDYTYTTLDPLVFPANQVDQIQQFFIEIIDDPIFEPGDNELIEVQLEPVASTVADFTGNIEIGDDDVAPTLVFQNTPISVLEGTSATRTTLTVTVMLQGGINSAVNVAVSTEDDTATATGNDYVPVSASTQLTFPANQVNVTNEFTVQITADGVDENNERFRALLVPSNPDIAGTSTYITINDDDTAGVEFSASSVNVTEGSATPGTYTIVLGSVPTSTVIITVDPDDQLMVAHPPASPALPGVPIQLTFQPDTTARTPQTVEVTTVNDGLVEGSHTGTISHTITAADPVYQNLSLSNVTALITDDDQPPLITPGQSRDVPEDNGANNFDTSITGTVRATGGTLQDWTIISTSPVSATGYFTIDPGTGQLGVTALGAGNLDYETPPISYTLTITVSDGLNLSDPEDVVVNVTDVNDETPVIPAQSRDVSENNGANDFDTPLTATDPDVSPTIFQNWTITSVNPITATGYFAIDANTGQLSLTASGASGIDFETPPNLYQLDVTVSDGVHTSAPQTIDVNVLDANDPPTAVDDTDNAIEDVLHSVAAPGVLDNDTDVDAAMDTLTVVEVNGNAADVGQNVTLVSGAILNLSADGSYTYNTNHAYDSLAAGDTDTDSFNYTVGDGNGGTDVGLVTITITGTNDAPTAVNDTGDTTQSSTSTMTAPGVLGNDTDIDSNPANFTVTAVNGSTASVGNQITLSSGALLTLNADGSYIYDPNGQYNNLAAGDTDTDNFTYTISDGDGGNDVGTVTITITGENDPPVAVDDTGTTDEDTLLTVAAPGVLGNDTDVDGTATLAVIAVNGSAVNVGVQITLSSGALLTLNADGSYTYDPNGQFESLAVGASTTDTFNYTVSDDTDSDVGSVTITINGVNDAPVAVNDTDSTDEDTPVSAVSPGVLGNDTDVDVPADTLVVTAVNGSGANVGTQITLASGALLTLNANGSYTYNPNSSFESLGTGDTDTDSFNYTVGDGHGGSDVGSVTITINGVNDAPALGGIAASTTYTEGMSFVLVAPAGAVTDPDQPTSFGGAVLTVEITANGTISDELGFDVASMPGDYRTHGADQIQRGPAPHTTIANYNTNPASWSTPLVITFTASATETDVQAVLRGIYYNNIVDSVPGAPNPSLLGRTVRFTFTDGQGGTSNQPTITINVVAAMLPQNGRIVAQTPVNKNSFRMDAL